MLNSNINTLSLQDMATEAVCAQANRLDAFHSMLAQVYTDDCIYADMYFKPVELVVIATIAKFSQLQEMLLDATLNKDGTLNEDSIDKAAVEDALVGCVDSLFHAHYVLTGVPYLPQAMQGLTSEDYDIPASWTIKQLLMRATFTVACLTPTVMDIVAGSTALEQTREGVIKITSRLLLDTFRIILHAGFKIEQVLSAALLYGETQFHNGSKAFVQHLHHVKSHAENTNPEKVQALENVVALVKAYNYVNKVKCQDGCDCH